MKPSYFRRVMFNVAAGGTADFLVTTAIPGHRTPLQAGTPNNCRVVYAANIIDPSSGQVGAWEVGEGVYVSATTTVQRTGVRETSDGSPKMNFPIPPVVWFDFEAQDMLSILTTTTNRINQSLIDKTDDGSTIYVASGAQIDACTIDTKQINFTFQPGSNILVNGSVAFKNCVRNIWQGNNASFKWNGPNDQFTPMFQIWRCQMLQFRSMYINCAPFDHPCNSAFWIMSTVGGGQVSTAQLFEDITIDATFTGGMKYGFRIGVAFYDDNTPVPGTTDNGDNNDFNQFYRVNPANIDIASFSIEQPESKYNHFVHCGEGGGAQYGVVTWLNGGRGGSFLFMEGGGGATTVADFALGQPDDTILIQGVQSEGSKRFLDTSTSAATWPVHVRNNRIDTSGVDTDHQIIRYNHRGPFLLEANTIGSGTDGIPIEVILGATGRCQGVAIGNTIDSTLGNPFTTTNTANGRWHQFGNMRVVTPSTATNVPLPDVIQVLTFAELPATGNVRGAICHITDSPTAQPGAIITTGGGSNNVFAWFSGNGWTVIGSGSTNIVSITDYGAVPDGVTNCGPAITAFKADYQGKGVTLYFPPGRYSIHGESRPFMGIKQLTILAYGATITSDTTIDVWCSDGIYQDNLHDSRFGTNAIGDFQVTLVTHAQASRFTANQWAYIGALDMQGANFPPNHYFNEFQKVVSTNTTSGVVGTDEALRNIYKSTYPVYDPGDASNTDLGGPATIYAMHPEWDMDFTLYGMTFEQNNQMYFSCRKSVLVDCTWTTTTPGAGPSPTWSKYALLDRCRIPEIEIQVDKGIEYLEFRDCEIFTIATPSASVQQMVITGSYVETVKGTARNTVVKDSDVDNIFFGPQDGFGFSETITIENCRIQNHDYAHNFIALTDFTNSHGTLTFGPAWRFGLGAVYWMVPGAKGFLLADSFNLNFGQPFEVLDVRQSGGNTLVDTTLPDPIPTIAIVDGTGNQLSAHPAASLTLKQITSTNDPFLLARAAFGPTPHAWRSRAAEIVQGNFGATAYGALWGYFVRIIVNVIKPYTGVASPTATMHLGGSSGFGFVKSDFTKGTFNPTIDLKTPGVRVIESYRISGIVGADSISHPPAPTSWLYQGTSPFLTENLTDTAEFLPIVEVRTQTSQGITNVCDYGGSLFRPEHRWLGSAGNQVATFYDNDVVQFGSGTIAIKSGTFDVMMWNAAHFGWSAGSSVFPGASLDASMSRADVGIIQFDQTWSGAATSPATLASGNTNNYDPGSYNYFLRITANAAGSGLTGFNSFKAPGETHLLVNLGTGTLTLHHQDAGSSAVNRFLNSTGADIALATNQAADLIYDGTIQRWRVFERNP